MQPGKPISEPKPDEFKLIPDLKFYTDFQMLGAQPGRTDFLKEYRDGHVVFRMQLQSPRFLDECDLFFPQQLPHNNLEICDWIDRIYQAAKNQAFERLKKDEKNAGSGWHTDFQVQTHDNGKVNIFYLHSENARTNSCVLIREKINKKVLAVIPLPTSQKQLKLPTQPDVYINQFTINISDEILKQVEILTCTYTFKIADNVPECQLAEVLNATAALPATQQVEQVFIDALRYILKKAKAPDDTPATLAMTFVKEKIDMVTVLASGFGPRGFTASQEFMANISSRINSKKEVKQLATEVSSSELKKETKTPERMRSNLLSQPCLVIPDSRPYETAENIKDILKLCHDLNIRTTEVSNEVSFEASDQNLVCRHTLIYTAKNPVVGLTGNFCVEIVSLLNKQFKDAEMMVFLIPDSNAAKFFKKHSSVDLPDLLQELKQLNFSDNTGKLSTEQLTELQNNLGRKLFEKLHKNIDKEINALYYYCSFIKNICTALDKAYHPVLHVLHDQLKNYLEYRFCFDPSERLCQVMQLKNFLNFIQADKKLDKFLGKHKLTEMLKDLKARLILEELFLARYGQLLQKMVNSPLQLTAPAHLKIPNYRSAWERASTGYKALLVIPLGIPAGIFYARNNDKTQYGDLNKRFFPSDAKKAGGQKPVNAEDKSAVLQAPFAIRSTVEPAEVSPVHFPPPFSIVITAVPEKEKKSDAVPVSLRDFIGIRSEDERNNFLKKNYAALFLAANKIYQSHPEDPELQFFLLNPTLKDFFAAFQQENTHTEIFQLFKTYSGLFQYFNQLNTVSLPGTLEAEPTPGLKVK